MTVSDNLMPKMSITGYIGQSEEELRAQLAYRREMLNPDPIEKERLRQVAEGVWIDILPLVRGY